MITDPSNPAKQAQKALGLRLREIRKSAGLTARVLATATNQHFTRISKIENGVQAPTDQDIRNWCRACGADNQVLSAPNDLDEAVKIRMERQEVIRRGGKRFGVLLEEQALRTWFGTAETQAAQLEHLLAMMALPNVSIGIIPMMTERAAVGSTGFWIFDGSLVALETPTASIEVNRPDEIALYVRMFEVLRASATYGPEARALVTKTLDELTS